jgi:predicted transcriptional regulator
MAAPVGTALDAAINARLDHIAELLDRALEQLGAPGQTTAKEPA